MGGGGAPESAVQQRTEVAEISAIKADLRTCFTNVASPPLLSLKQELAQFDKSEQSSARHSTNIDGNFIAQEDKKNPWGVLNDAIFKQLPDVAAAMANVTSVFALSGNQNQIQQMCSVIPNATPVQNGGPGVSAGTGTVGPVQPQAVNNVSLKV